MRPVSGVPRLSVRIGDRELAPREAGALTSVRVRQALSLPAACELTFTAPPPSLVDAASPDHAIAVAAGDTLFTGELTAVETVWEGRRVRELRLRGYDRLHRLRKRQPIRVHANMTAAALARELAADLGIDVATESDSPPWPWVLQWRQSDLELLAEVAARSGLYLVLDAGVLRLVTLEGAGEPMPMGAGEGLLECEVEVNSDRACGSVEAAGFDLAAVETRRARADGSWDGRPPAQRLASERACLLADVPSAAPAHLEEVARAELARRIASAVVLRGVAEGDARLRPGARVELSGVAAHLRGTYVLTSTEHLIDPRRGFVSHVSTEPPPAPVAGDGAGATLGEVTQVEAERGRVKLRLGAFGDVETDWLPVASAGAGAGKGVIAMPDVGDVVLTVFHRGEPARGVVLAGLWSPSGPPDAGVHHGRVRRWALRSAGGQRVELDDERAMLRLADEKGSFLEISPDGVKLHAAVPLTIEAPGNRVVVLGDAVDFRRG